MPDHVAATPSPTFQDGVLKAHASVLSEQAQNLLGRLIQKEQYVGEVLDPTFDHVKVLVNDYHRKQVGGIPSMCYLIATRLMPGAPIDPDDEDSCIVLLRVLDGATMPDEAEKQQVRHQAATGVIGENKHWDDEQAIDAYTATWLNHSGLKCRVVGTFYLERKDKSDLQLRLGADISNYYPNRALQVYKPVGAALEAIVNHANVEDGGATGRSFEVGTVRYSSTRRMRPDVDEVKVRINPEDLLGQKTALFGMTRTGKSNTTKILIQSVFDLRYTGRRVGQLVLDPDGEYSNPNPQDGVPVREIATSHSKGDPNDVVVYGMVPKADDPTRRLLRLNFFSDEHLEMGKEILCATIADEKMDQSNYVKSFREASLVAPPDPQDKGAMVRWRRQVLVYRALLAAAGFPVPKGLHAQTNGLFSSDLIQAMAAGNGKDPQGYTHAATILSSGNPTWQQLGVAFKRLYDFMHDKKSGYLQFESNYVQNSASGDEWADATLRSLLEMIGRPGGTKMAAMATAFHDPAATADYAAQIYEDLRNGKLVIIDQSSGSIELNRKAAERIMWHVFLGNFKDFTNDARPLRDILIYVEEAHNILPRGEDDNLQNVWVRTAKEGAKAAIGLVYATQEVTSIQKNILKNTSNWFVAHLNNADETKEISKYSDFTDFEDSIRRAPDRGFLRVKTRSNPFVVPVQIRRFEV